MDQTGKGITESVLTGKADNNIFEVDELSDLPIWVQLRNRIAYLIRTGYFAVGEPLPSVRSMCAAAKINYNTVMKAYHNLEQGGLIVSARGRGMFVSKDAAVEDDGTDATDALAEECLKRYRQTGMSYTEAAKRITAIAVDLQLRSTEARDEKRGYWDDGQEE